MTTFLLIRHGLHALGADRIAGRLPDVHLSAAGRAEAAGLVPRLASVPIDALLCSPLARTVDTAAPLCEARGLELRRTDQLLEIDYGEWTGARFAELAADARWRRWNEFRSRDRIPGGESMLEVLTRVIPLLHRLSVEQPNATFALVTHADIIRSAVAHLLGTPLDLFLRIEIGTASVTSVVVGDAETRVLCVNNTAQLAHLPFPYVG